MDEAKNESQIFQVFDFIRKFELSLILSNNLNHEEINKKTLEIKKNFQWSE